MIIKHFRIHLVSKNRTRRQWQQFVIFATPGMYTTLRHSLRMFT